MKNIKLRILLAFFPILISTITWAQERIIGRIYDESTKEPVMGAVVYIHDLKLGSSTDTAGFFMMDRLPQGHFLAEIRAIGYSNKILEINNKDKNKSDTLLIYLTHSAMEMQTVIVTGVSATTDNRRSPIPITLVDNKYLEQNTATNIIDALAKVPGFSAVTTGPNVSKPFIRGLGYNRILTMFDGVRQDGQQWGDEHGIEMDQYLIDRAEIVKGPASLMYGSDALAGVVNLLPANPVPRGTIRGNVIGNFQSNNLQWANSVGLVSNQKGIIWGFRLSHKQAADYKNKYDGRVFGTKYNETDINANIGLQRKWGNSLLNFSLYDNTQEIPDGSRDSTTRKFTKQISEHDSIRPIVSDGELSSYKIGVIHQRVQHYRVYTSNNFYIGASRLAVKLGLQQSVRREFSHPILADLAGLNLVLNTFTYDAKYFVPEFSGYQVVIGVNGLYQHNTNNGATEFVIPNYRSFDLGPFVHVKKQFGKFDLSGGLRYDTRSFSNQELYTKTNSTTGFDMQTSANANDTTVTKQFDIYQQVFSGISASAGSTYNINEQFCLKANIARGYRSPNIAEISAKGVHPGTGFQQLGDANFKPEFSLQGDIGSFYYGKHFSGSLEIFHNYLTNYIFNQKLTSTGGGDSLFVQGGNPYPVFKFHQTNARLFGGEASIDFHPHPFDWLHFENSISIVLAKNVGGNGAIITDSTKYLPYITPIRTNHEIRAELNKKMACFSNVFLRFGIQYFAPQNRAFLAYNTETKTLGYTLLEAAIGTDFVNKKGRKLFTMNIVGTNLADVAYQSNMSRLKYMDNYPQNWTGRSGIYNMGRNISVKITIPVGG